MAAAPGSGIREMSAGNFTLDEDAISNSAGMDHGSRLALAGVLASYVALGNWVYSCTDTWILANSNPGMTGKALRDWLVTQLMWADNGRLGMMRAADYLNAATSEVPVSVFAVTHNPTKVWSLLCLKVRSLLC